MNNAKLWLVVPPKVGLPIFLGAVAVGSFAVHVAVLSKTNWYQDYLLGQDLGTSAGMASAALTAGAAPATAKVSYAAPAPGGGQEVTIIMPDGTTARAVIQPNPVLASSAAPPAATTD